MQPSFFARIHIAHHVVNKSTEGVLEAVLDFMTPPSSETRMDRCSMFLCGVEGGYSLFIRNGRPLYHYNFVTQACYEVTWAERLSPGPNVIRVEFFMTEAASARAGR